MDNLESILNRIRISGKKINFVKLDVEDSEIKRSSR